MDSVNIDKNIWNSHPVYKNYYGSKSGLIWSTRSDRLLNGYKTKSGYIKVKINKKNIPVHRFIYECWLGNILENHDIDHIDNKKDNNNVKNLQMLSKKDHNLKTRSQNKQTNDKHFKPIIRFKIDLENQKYDIKKYPNQIEAAKDVSRSRVSINDALYGRSITCAGYFWKFVKSSELPGEYWCCLSDSKFRKAEFSNFGRVKTRGRITYGSLYKSGYYRIVINGGKYSVHRLICLAFNGKAPKYHYTVDHIDRDRTNNNYKNLRWATSKIQVDNSCSKMVIAYKDGSEYGKWNSMMDAERELDGVYGSNISKCISGKLKKTGGFTWKFIEV